MDADLALVLRSQKEFIEEHVKLNKKKKILDVDCDGPRPKKSFIDPSLDCTDPTLDLYKMFVMFDKAFFWSSLGSVKVSWSSRMTRSAGICVYKSTCGTIAIRLSLPLLKLRPRIDLIETLLHEMIHAYLIVTNNNIDREPHGPEFQFHMFRINQSVGTNITIYHDFHAEVDFYKAHWWRCNGPCQYQMPSYGVVKRFVNRVPGPKDSWFADHQQNCGGTFIKVKEPENFKSRKKLAEKEVPGNSFNRVKTLPDFFKKSSSNTVSKSSGVGYSGVEIPNSTMVSEGGSASDPKRNSSGISGAKNGGTFTATKGGTYIGTEKPEVSSPRSGTSTSPKAEMSMSSTASSKNDGTSNGGKTFPDLNGKGDSGREQPKSPVYQNIVPISRKGYISGRITVPVSDNPRSIHCNANNNGGTVRDESSSIDRYSSNSSASSRTVGTNSPSIGSYMSNASILYGTKTSGIQWYKTSTSMPFNFTGAESHGIEKYLSRSKYSGNYGLGTYPSSSSHSAVSSSKMVRVGFPKDEAQCYVACPLCNKTVKACDINWC